MARHFTRRTMLACTGALLAAPLACSRRKDAPRLDVHAPLFDALVKAVAETRSTRLLEELAGFLRRGVTADWLLLASYHAVLRYRADREDVHSMLVVDAARRVSVGAPERDRLQTALWVAAFANTWVLPSSQPESPVVTRAPMGASVTEALEHAVLAGDEEAAATAVGAAMRAGHQDDVITAVCLQGTRARRDPHVAIYVANALQTLDALGWQDADRVLGSVARRVARGGTHVAAELAALRDAQQRARRVRMTAGHVDEAASLELLDALRTADGPTVEEEVVACLERGVAVSSVWDALRLAACEALLLDPAPSGNGVHATTLTQALFHLSGRVSSEAAQRTVLLQGAGWVASLMAGRLAPATARLTPAHFSSTMPDLESLRKTVMARADDPHAYKLTAAVMQHLPHMSPRFQSALVACALPALPQPDATPWALAAEANTMLQTL